MSLLLSLSLLSCQEQINEGEVTLTVSVLGKNESSRFGFKQATLLDVVKTKCDVETKKTIYTEYLTCIDNICANDEFSWVYYVNDDPINQGIDIYEVKNDDKILVIYKKV
ncbi:MAG: DUF4430 domain-containing protein [Nanoarchaeota archaeon]|nr:DUF4430 domain-containing protein [Nanoarchaeota archaeon]MBU1854220.1 DUF4430 domain-containing protein [Nanoarchaeota archaeon]